MLYSSIRFVIIFLYDMMLENEPSTVAFIQVIVELFLEIVHFREKWAAMATGSVKILLKESVFEAPGYVI